MISGQPALALFRSASVSLNPQYHRPRALCVANSQLNSAVRGSAHRANKPVGRLAQTATRTPSRLFSVFFPRGLVMNQ